MMEDQDNEIQEVCRCLRKRNVEEKIIQNFQRNKMDKEAVWSASEDDLASLGLTEKGDVLTLKSFCIPRNNDTSGELANLIKSTGAERIPRKKQKLRRLDMKSVSVGWKVLDKDSGKYKYVRAEKGGGARNIHFSSNSTASDIITKMTELFYPNGKSRFGRQTEFSFCLGNFRGQIIEESSSEPFVLSNYIKVNMLSKTRLYLLAKKKSRLGIMTDIAQSSLDCRSDSDSEDLTTPPYDATDNLLIGTSKEYSLLNNKINASYQRSLQLDEDKEKKNC